jgi:hypothetical protein
MTKQEIKKRLEDILNDSPDFFYSSVVDLIFDLNQDIKNDD